MIAVTAAGVLSIGRADPTYAAVPINFTRGTLAGAGFATTAPGSLAFGPDGRLYVADTNGRIQQLTLDPTTKAVTAVTTLTLSTQLLEVYGIAFDPVDDSLWVTNTVSGFGDAGIAPGSGSPGAYPGKVTRLARTGTNGSGAATYAAPTDVITGLPVSNSGHQANGLAFGPDGRLYIAQGSTTNAGVLAAPGAGLFQREEVPTSAALLVADVHDPGFNGAITYSPANEYSVTVDQVTGDVSPFAVGLRNPYDIVFHSNGVLYNTDNGPNNGYGPGSATCSTTFGSDAQAADELNIIVEDGYYGHPNRNRGIQTGDPRQCVYHPGTDPSTADYTAPIGLLGPSSNGLAEYKANTFAGQMQGDLLYVGWVNNDLRRVRLSPDGQSVVSDTLLANGFGNPLDVAVGSDGTVYVAEWGGNKITFFKPDETPVTSMTVTNIFPSGGPLTGGQALTITGTNFTVGDTTVTIGGAAMTNVVVQNSTTITGLTPAGTAGAKDVVVTSASYASPATLAGGYTYSEGGGIFAPVADAGPDVSTPLAHENHAHVILDGRNSYDPDAGSYIAAYEWSENGVILSTAAVDSKQFVLGEHFVTLKVTDADGQEDTDIIRINVVAVAENPVPFYCNDVNGDGTANSLDLSLVAQRFGRTWFSHRLPAAGIGYARAADANTDLTINSLDLMRTAQDFGACSQLDQDIRTATLGTEPFMDITNATASSICVYRSLQGYQLVNVVKNVSEAACSSATVASTSDAGCPVGHSSCIREWYEAGYSQTTPYIPGQGRHMGKGGGIFQNDDVFEAERPESLLYEPDSRFPQNWRLGGLMWVMPIDQVPLPPEGFPGLEDPWHYHDGLCLWKSQSGAQYPYTGVNQNVTEEWCMERQYDPVWIEKAGWLVHLWAFVANPVGRFVEVNDNF